MRSYAPGTRARDVSESASFSQYGNEGFTLLDDDRGMAPIDTQRTSHDDAASGATPLRDWVRALEATATIAARPQRLLSDLIAELAQTQPHAPALISAGERLTYAALTERANRFARWAHAAGLRKGDTVGLMMPNRPEYMAIWLGLTGTGVVVALLNPQLQGAALAHCVAAAAPRHVIVTAELSAQMRSAAASLPASPKVWAHGADGERSDRIDRAVEQFLGAPLSDTERRQTAITDPALLIYTSGTTGLPKAAYVSHRRLLQWSLWFAGLMNTGPADCMYDCLPMYHSIGGVVATGALLVRGGSVLIRDRFSQRHFWDDVVDGGCTLFQYIGELCRYLVNAPEHPRERAHRLRLCCGNGLRADVWQTFQDRFAVPRILEFYAATEGNVSLYNVEGKVGAIGRLPPFLAPRFPLALVKFDPDTAAPARGADGRCVRCATDEIGEAIGRIPTASKEAGANFEGYTDEQASEQKIVRDVFAAGDAWYRTGDLMRQDASGFFYFVDRIGDTFRWKGENVATSEVAAAVMAFPGIREAIVYGVRVAGTEGAAGMATIVAGGELDLGALRDHLARRLPSYAQPLFVRITDKLDATATFKHTRADLVREGFDPATGDPIYFNDASRKEFVPLDTALFGRIQAGKVRL
jgi:fatty-acyl-CoA synthase